MKLRLTAAMAVFLAGGFAAVPQARTTLTNNKLASDPLISNSPLSTTATAG